MIKTTPPILFKYKLNFSILPIYFVKNPSSSDVSIKGIDKPKEYTPKSSIPSLTVDWLPANISIDPNTAPIQGVHPAPKAIPIRVELKKLFFLFGALNPCFLLRKPIFITPSIYSPKNIINKPLILLNNERFLFKKPPKKVAEAPNIIKIILNPSTNPIVLVKFIFLKFV